MSSLGGDARNRSSSLERKRVYASPSVYYNNDESWKRQLLGGSSNRSIASVRFNTIKVAVQLLTIK